MNHQRRLRVLLSVAAILVCVWAIRAQAQVGPTSTPAPVQVPTLTPLPTLPQTGPGLPQSRPTLEAMPPTATPEGLVLIEAIGSINVRSAPELGDNVLGQIAPGTQYVATARSFNWVQIRYEGGPTGLAWVYTELVQATGALSSLPEFTPELVPTEASVEQAASATIEALLLQPDGAITATALARVIVLPSPQAGQAFGADGAPALLPTFTFPAGARALAPTPVATDESLVVSQNEAAFAPSAQQTPNAVAPIVPILLLGGFGALGLFVSAARR